MKILVTGGAGFIGGNFVHHMVKKYPEYEIVNLDLLTYAGNLETLKPVEHGPYWPHRQKGFPPGPWQAPSYLRLWALGTGRNQWALWGP